MTNFLSTILSASLLLPFGFLAYCQPANLQFESITTNTGLSQDIVTCVHRDRVGFLWVGTEDGLNRYDGYAIKIYKHNPADSSTLPSSWIIDICDYDADDLLVLTNRGISIYRRASDSFVRLPKSSPLPTKSDYSRAVQDKTGNYWFINEHRSVLKCSRDFTTVSSFDTHVAADSIEVNTLFVDSKGRILVGADSRLRVFGNNFSTPADVHLVDPGLPAAQQFSVKSIAEEQPGIFWLGTNQGLYRYSERANTLECVSLFESAHGKGRDLLFELAWDSRGRLWAAGFGGLYCYDPHEHRSTRYPTIQENPLAAPSRVYSVYIDPAEMLWVGTWGEGLNKTNLHKEQFGLLRHSAQTPFAGGTSAIGAIYEEPDGTLWLGDQNHGVTISDQSMKSFKQWSPGSLSGTRITAITGDDNGNVWIASNYGMLDWYNTRSKKMRHVHLPPTPKEKQTVFTMAVDSGGFLWIGTEAHGVYRFDLQHETFEPFGNESADSMYHRIKSAWSFYFDEDRNLWIGGWVENPGLHRIDAKTRSLRSYGQLELLSARSIVSDGQKGLWVGTWGNGITQFNPVSGAMHNYTERDGLPSNYVKGILRDGRGILWISTEKGLSKFDPITGVFRNYDVSDGLQGNFFYSGSCTKGNSGRLYFGGTNGANAFFPDSIHDIAYTAPVVLTSFRIFDRPKFFNRSLSLLQQVELSHDDNLFAFEYVSLDYRASVRHSYAYMMEGIDHDWIQAGTRRGVSYAHLDPGTYVFNVRGTNSDGVWNPIPASIRIVIAPAFWQTWWFRVSAVIALMTLLYALYRYRIDKLLELERTRAAIATDLHDDIGTSLTNIALFSDLARRDVARGSPDVTNRLEKISQTSRSLLDSMNDIVWSIKPENDALEQTVLRMEDYAVKTLEDNGIDLHAQIPDQLRTLKLPMNVRRNLFLIFKEAIGNVLKHAGATHVDVIISSGEPGKRSSELSLSIADNGCGFNRSTLMSGNGLGNMELRARHLNGTLEVVSAEGRGTKIKIRFPIKSPI